MQLQINTSKVNFLRGVLKDDTDSVCRTIEKDILFEMEEMNWTGLDDLPYGRYILELSNGDDEPVSYRVKMNLVKRV
ncbi:MAG: hypothetical protein ABIP79_04090 [Chitinophagaceae bacterium]